MVEVGRSEMDRRLNKAIVSPFLNNHRYQSSDNSPAMSVYEVRAGAANSSNGRKKFLGHFFRSMSVDPIRHVGNHFSYHPVPAMMAPFK